jgi:hypothetical protein
MAEFLRDLLRNGYNGVKPIETIQKKNNLGQQVKDVVSAELSKTGKRVLFYKQLPTLYGSDLVRISTKGSVDPARTLSVATTRYVDLGKNRPTLGKLIGNLLGGSANRPSDTIFPANAEGIGIASEPPVSINGQPINGDWNGLKYAVEADKNYVVSQEPAGKNALTGLLKGNPSDIARNAAGAITDAAKNAVKNVAINALTSRRKNAIGDLSNKLKNSNNLNTYVRLPNTYEKPGSRFIKVKNQLGKLELVDAKVIGIKYDENGNPNRDYLIDNALLRERLIDYKRLGEIISQNTGNNLQFIQIKVSGKPNYLLFPATITDIQDNMTPEWSSFKYVGSPFNNYRYTGVERKISFDFRVYWLDNTQQDVMRDKLNLLRNLVYPSTDLVSIPLSTGNYSPLVFTPNTIELSIGNLYNQIDGFVSNLSITVPQEAPWATSNPNFLKNNINIVYPTFVDVSFEMTIIENHRIKSDNTITYQFDDSRPTLPTLPGLSIGKNPGLVLGLNPTVKPKLDEVGDRTDWSRVAKGERRNQITYDTNGNILSQRNAPAGNILPVKSF